MTESIQSTLEVYLKSPEEIRYEQMDKILEEKYWRATNEPPKQLIERTEKWLESSKGDQEVWRVAILLDEIENGTVNDLRNPRNKGKERVRLEPMNWNLLTTLALIMKKAGR
ncbi:MAG: hypothetical protein M0Z77_01005 [Thermoplasmatales archaeon]|nr:hypothetical protein [Thermoplasmatales archaeon]